MTDGFSGFDRSDLALKLKVNGLLHMPKGIEVFNLNLGPKLRSPDGPDRNVDVASKRALFHVAV